MFNKKIKRMKSLENLMQLFMAGQPTILLVGCISFIIGVLLIQIFGGNSRVGNIEENFFTNTAPIMLGIGIGCFAYFLFTMLVTGDMHEISRTQVVLMTCGSVLFILWNGFWILGFISLIIDQVTRK